MRLIRRSSNLFVPFGLKDITTKGLGFQLSPKFLSLFWSSINKVGDFQFGKAESTEGAENGY